MASTRGAYRRSAGIEIAQARLELDRLLAVTTVGGKNGLKQYGARVRDRIRANISQPSPPPSQPGGPPHRDSGELRDSYTYEVHDLAVDIGSDLEYAAYLEYGTYKMAARPHLRPALEQEHAPRTISQAILAAQYVYG